MSGTSAPGKADCRKSCAWPGIENLEEANHFLRQRYIQELNAKFAVAAKERGTAFRKTSPADLDWIFSVQSERVVARDNTITFRDQI